jgi:hypothetical protein
MGGDGISRVVSRRLGGEAGETLFDQAIPVQPGASAGAA